jgi:transposase-like protein
MEAEQEQEKKKQEKRVYDEAFRREAVALLESSGEPLSELATRLGGSHWNLLDWRERYGAPARRAKGDQGGWGGRGSKRRCGALAQGEREPAGTL